MGQSLMARSRVGQYPDFAGAREVAREHDSYQNEVRFYGELCGKRALPVPRACAAEVDEASGEFILLLEDLSGARRGSLFRSSVGAVHGVVSGIMADS